jgi:hypothetical protein
MKIRVEEMEGEETSQLVVVAPEEMGSLFVGEEEVLRRKEAREMCFRNQRVFMKKTFAESGSKA